MYQDRGQKRVVGENFQKGSLNFLFLKGSE